MFGHLWRETGCQAVLHRHLAGRRFGFDVERAIYLTVLHRLMISGSDRHASMWQQTLDIPGAKDLMLDHAYKAMAWLGEAIDGDDGGQARHCTDAIEEMLYQHRRSLFSAISVAFFDTTSLYFEGHGGATLGQPNRLKEQLFHNIDDLKVIVIVAPESTEDRGALLALKRLADLSPSGPGCLVRPDHHVGWIERSR